MTKLEYSDRPRFVASAGAALIVSAVLAPWLFLKEQFDLLLKRDDLANLTDTARQTISSRQAEVWLLTYLVPLSSLIMLIYGICLFRRGMKQWKKKQKIQDRMEQLNAEKLEREARGMSSEEIQEKRKSSMQEFDHDHGSVFRVSGYEQESKKPSASDKKGRFEKFSEIEERVLNKIKQCDPKIFELLVQRTIAERNFDAILVRKSGKRPDILIEIRYITRKPTKDEFYRLHDRQVAVSLAYERATRRKARSVILVITADADLEKETRNVWFQPRLQLIARRDDQVIAVMCEAEIENQDFGEIVAGDLQFTDDGEAWDGMHGG